MEELRATTAEKASIENELKIAHDIQMSMLPKTFPPYPERSDIDIFGSLTPAKDVGGDLFDFYIMHTPDHGDRLCFCIGDVSGKGVPASLVMATTRSLFRNISAHVSNPGNIVRVINEAQVEGNEAAMFVTLFVGILDLADGRLLYCNAGHNPPMLLGSELSYLPCDPNLPAGLMPEIDFTVQETVLQPGDIIFLYTDGLNEAEDAAQAQFGEERMEQVASRLMAEGTRSTKTVVERMTEAVKGFVGDAEQSDDLTMLAIEWRPLGNAYSDSRSEKSK
jgi:sigma-B regulation protein RsbU (phosphoserine phosphatase)